MIRAAVERYRFNDALGEKAGVNLFFPSLVFLLGRTAIAMATTVAYVPPVHAAPVPTAPSRTPPVVIAERMAAPAPPPAPVAAAPSTRPLVKRGCLAAETLSGFDRAELRPGTNVSLDRFVRDLQGTTFDSTNVIGHTDRLGSATYNQKLSQQHAAAMKNYVTSNGRSDSSNVTAMGKGKSPPLTNASECKGNKPSIKLIACWQPDRRVDLDVNRTRYALRGFRRCFSVGLQRGVGVFGTRMFEMRAFGKFANRRTLLQPSAIQADMQPQMCCPSLC